MEINKDNLYQYYNIIYETIRRALNRETEIETGIKSLSNGNEYMTGYTKDLYDYLQSLDFNSIKVIQTIMYIGRDSFFDDNNGKCDFDEVYDYFNGQGWNTKEIETNQIDEKTPLGRYLINGLYKINFLL